MFRILLSFLLTLFIINSFSQVDSFRSNSTIGSKVMIDALHYTNAINKYYFNEASIDKLARFLIENETVYIEVNCFSDFKKLL